MATWKQGDFSRTSDLRYSPVIPLANCGSKWRYASLTINGEGLTETTSARQSSRHLHLVTTKVIKEPAGFQRELKGFLSRNGGKIETWEELVTMFERPQDILWQLTLGYPKGGEYAVVGMERFKTCTTVITVTIWYA